jgi:hypothetical protein
LARHTSSKVVEASFKIWSHVGIIPKLIDHTKVAFSIIHPSIMKTMSDHWKRSTQLHCLAALRAMQELDPDMFEELKLAPKKKPPLPEKDPALGKLARNWGQVARMAVQRDSSLQFTVLMQPITRAFGEPM